MLREIPEEVCARPTRWEYVKAVTFHWRDEGDRHIVHLYNILEWEGEPRRPAEASPEFLEVAWVPKEALPYDKMFAADQHFVPYWIGNKEFRDEFWYNNKRDAQLIDVPMDRKALNHPLGK
jgi:ADP-ribose pyrophosphatase YjhB (NUDIX family)